MCHVELPMYEKSGWYSETLSGSLFPTNWRMPTKTNLYAKGYAMNTDQTLLTWLILTTALVALLRESIALYREYIKNSDTWRK